MNAAMTDFNHKGPNLFEASPGWIATKGTSIIKEGVIYLESPESGKFSFKVPVEPDAEYFFSAKVKSEGRVVFTTQPVSISYHDQGQWGEVCGLIPAQHRNEVELRVQFRPLVGKGRAEVELKEVVFRKVSRPTMVAARRLPGETALVAAGKPEAVIVYPSALDAEKALAQEVQEKIRKQTGVKIDLVSDVEVTERDAPVIKPEFREKNLIVIGRVGTNRALVASYSRFLDAVDGYYPGGDGYVVRTAANVFGNGRNHLILGGSEPAGVANAVAQFLSRLDEIKGGSDLRVPWLLDVKLAGSCKEAFAADNERWRDPNEPDLPPMSAGYGKVSRWYQNAMGYYWSGLPQYRERSNGYLKEILSDKAYTHHYLAEYFVRAYGMFNESPVITDEEKSALEALMMENFLDLMTGSDASWMTVFSPPYEEIGLVNRHQIAPWTADLALARFLKDNLNLTGDLKALVDFRFSEKNNAFRYFVSNRCGPNRYELGSSTYDEVTATFFRYAMENDLYKEFFASGLAKDALGLERLDPLTGRLSMPVGTRDLPPLLGLMGILENDGQYRWLRENTPFQLRAAGSFQGRYIAGVHRYQSGDELPAVKPGASWTGIKVSPVPSRLDRKLVPPTSEFPLLSLRSGFELKDDYIAITGAGNSQPAGTVAALVVAGNAIMTAADGEESFNRTSTNGATAIRLTGYQPTTAGAGREACLLNWTADFSGCQAFQTETAITPEIQWSRSTVRLGAGLFVFCDRFTASKAGEYVLRVNWQPGERIMEKGGIWELALPTGGVQVKMLGEGFTAHQREGTLAWTSIRSMEVGKPVTVWTVVQAGRSPSIKATERGDTRIDVTPVGSQPIILNAGNLLYDSGRLEADLVVMDATNITVLGPTQRTSLRRDTSDAAPIAQALAGAVDPVTGYRNPSGANATVIQDSTQSWKMLWSYDGLLKPKEIKPRVIDESTIDFGKVVSLDEVRSVSPSKRVWEPSYLPEGIRIASGSKLPDNDAAWVTLAGTKKSRSGTRSGNYGESHPVSHADESLFVNGTQTRYLKADGAASARYYMRNETTARHPVRVEVRRDLPGIDGPLIAASSDLFPAFPRSIRDDDFSLALLKSDGSALVQVDIDGPVNGSLVADRQGKGTPEIMVLKADARIEIYDLLGNAGSVVDLSAMHKEFNQKYGRPNTRHPAGGLTMPFSFGLWRPNSNGAKKVVVGRYGNLSFLDENLQLEGVLASAPYANSGMLASGIDFSGNGVEEIVLLERSSLIQIGGESKARLRHKKAHITWPEVYDVLFEKGAVDSGTRLLAGAPIHVFEVLKKFGGRPRYIMVARESYLGLYDAVEKKWVFSWKPPASIAASAVTFESSDRADVQLSTVDGLYWKASWQLTELGTPTFTVTSPGWVANDLRGNPARDGNAVISTDNGLLLSDPNGAITRIAPGIFQSADFLSNESDARRSIVAADGAGKIVSYRD